MAQEKHNIYFPAIVVLFGCLLFHVYDALEYDVGGNEGWVLNPSENYNHWSGRKRFQVNDTLLFRYSKGSETVLEVCENDYLNCNTKNPITKMVDGYSVFNLDRSGPFYFISGNQSNCQNGQKLTLIVISPRNKNTTNTTTPPPPTKSPLAAAPPPFKGCPSNTPPSSSKAPSPAPLSSGESPPAGVSPVTPPSSKSPPVEPPENTPPVGDGCNDPDVRSDPANVNKSAAPAEKSVSATLVFTFLLVTTAAFGEFLS